MDDHAALVAAVCDRPDDDTPRLVLADWLDDHGAADRAAFVRAQVELARTPAWEPFAVACRHRRPEWSDAGEPFRAALPTFPAGWGVEWAEPPFRRGLGWRVRVGKVHGWEDVAPELFRAAPVGALHLRAPAATLDDWRRLAAGPWMGRVREIHVEAAVSPVEPVRALAAAGTLTGLTALHLHRADIPGIDFLVADVLDGPLGANLRGLSFRFSSTASLDDLMDELAARAGRFEALALRSMNVTGEQVRRAAPAFRSLHGLDLSDNYVFHQDGARALAEALAGGWAGRVLRLSRCGIAVPGARALAAAPGLASVRLLDLSRNVFGPTGVQALAASPHLAGLRALDLRSCGFGDQAVRRLVRGTFWPNLTELDLRGNPITDRGAGYLMAAPAAPDLTALLVSGRYLRRPARATLAKHYGGRVVFETDE